MKHIFDYKIVCRVSILIVLIMSKMAFAEPPFLTDDPEPVDYRHYEFELHSSLDKNNIPVEEPQLLAPSLEVNWGVIPNVHLHIVVPYAWSLSPAAPAANGLGDIEIGIKYRFIQETSTRPQIGFFPLFELPTGDTYQSLGNGKLWMKLPIWLQKSWGEWTTYGGGGYALNSAIYNQVAMRNYPFAGWLLQRNLNEQLTLGVELFSQGAVSVQSNSFTIINAGGTYKVTQHFRILFSAGHSIFGEQHLDGFLGVCWSGGS